jgi:Arc/MetJ family transcription regulator
MRTNVDINDELLLRAKAVTGLKTKKAIIEEGLKRIVTANEQLEAFNALWGLADWEGNLENLRKDRDSAKW